MEVKIRPLREEDAYVSYKWRNDPLVFKYTCNRYTSEITLESELEWIRRVTKNPADYRCAIGADGVYVGNIYLTDITNKEADYHIFIGDRNYWGKGVAKKASQLLIKYGFETLNLDRINLQMRTENHTAYHLYLTLGFIEIERSEEFITMSLPKKDLYE